MKLSKLFFRDKQTQSVDIVELYEVRWTSRHGAYSSNTRQEIRVFTTKPDAEDFASALKDAFKLLNHTSGTCISIKKQIC